MGNLNVSLFGIPTIHHEGAPRTPQRRHTLALLAYLAVTQVRHTREALATFLWPESRNARRNLRNVLLDARNQLGQDVILTVDDALTINPDAIDFLDIHVFQTAMFQLESRPADGLLPLELFHQLCAAGDIYRAPLLDGFHLDDAEQFHDWLGMQRRHFEADAARLLRAITRHHVAAGQGDRAIDPARRWAELDPLSEEVHAELIQLYIQTGQLAAAKAQYARFVQILERELKVAPSATLGSLIQSMRVIEDAQVQASPPDTPSNDFGCGQQVGHGEQSGHVDALTPLRGRDAAIADVRALLEDESIRLVTVMGPGGIGKTRLASQIVAAMPGDRGESQIVYLAPLNDSRLVPTAIAHALNLTVAPGQTVQRAIQAYLANRTFLLVLDNFEHVRTAVDDITELLAACPRLTVLITSRESVNTRGEHRYVLGPLSYPGERDGEKPGINWSDYSAVQLFLDRLRAIHGNWSHSAAAMGTIVKICRRLDGLPLALELAAARTGVISLPELLDALTGAESPMASIAHPYADMPARHQSLHATLTWSYRLLTHEEQALLRRLAAFRGGFAPAAVAELNRDELRLARDPMALLGSLVDKSLVMQVSPPERATRFRLLEPIREFALEQLSATDEANSVTDRHAHLYLALAEEAKGELHRHNQIFWLDRLELEQDNVRAALTWFDEQGDPISGLRMCTGIWRFWAKRPYVAEGAAWFARFLELRTPFPRTSLYAEAFGCAAVIEAHAGNLNRAHFLVTQCVQMARALDDQQILADFLGFLGNVVYWKGHKHEGAAIQDEALAICRRHGDPWATGATLNNLGLIALEHGDDAKALATSREALTLFRSFGDDWGVAYSLSVMGNAYRQQGEFEPAKATLEQRLAIAQSVANHRQIVSSLNDLAVLAHDTGDHALARQYLIQGLTVCEDLRYSVGAASLLATASDLLAKRDLLAHALVAMSAAEATRRQLGLPTPADVRETMDVVLARAEERLGPADATAQYARGQTMTVEDLFDIL